LLARSIYFVTYLASNVFVLKNVVFGEYRLRSVSAAELFIFKKEVFVVSKKRLV
jgi:hypothetical protein